MNVVLTVESYQPLKNGVQEITQAYAEFLAKYHIVRVVTKRPENTPEAEEINGVKVYRVKVYTKKSIYYGDIQKYKQLLNLLCQEADVLINVCTQTALTDCILKDLDRLECKKILYLHGIAHFTFPSVQKIDCHDVLSWILNVVRWKRFYIGNKKNFEKYDAIIHLHEKDPSYKMCKDLNCENFILENIAGPDILYAEHKQDSCGYLMIANYLHDKNQELALEAFYKSDSKRKLTFVGSKETKYLEQLRKKAKKYEIKYGKKKIAFLTGESHKDTMKRLSNSYALIHSSKSEKYPVVICEALKVGIPFIATDTGIVKYIPGGIIANNVDDMTEAINKIETDITMYNRLSSDGYNYSQINQDFNTNALKLKEIIEKI